MLEGPSELSRRERAVLKLRVKSCLECGYLAVPKATLTGALANLDEDTLVDPGSDTRSAWRSGQSVSDIRFARCTRRLWSNTSVDDAHSALRNVLRPRMCSRFFPYSEGLPAEHREAHRSRTNRRWLVAGALVGPYVAAAVGFAVSELSNSDPSQGFPTSLVVGLAIGLVGLLAATLIVNMTLNRGG